ncbi:MAG: sirohydrochlorin chelatase, partial [Usitatibacter sp.]
MRGIVLFAHGARDPEWAGPFLQIRDRIRGSRPECPIEIAFLDSMSPTLEEAIQSLLDEAIASLAEEGASSITVFPLFMAQGGHLKQDLPRILSAIRASYPHVPIALEAALGDSPEILDA